MAVWHWIMLIIMGVVTSIVAPIRVKSDAEIAAEIEIDSRETDVSPFGLDK